MRRFLFANLATKTWNNILKAWDLFIDFLNKGWDQIKKMLDEVFDAFKIYFKEVGSSLNSQIPFLGKAEIELYRKLMVIFYKGFKNLLIEYKDLAKVMRQWEKLKPMKDLAKSDIEIMLNWRKKFIGEKKSANVAIMKQKVSIKGEVIELEYKAFAGGNAEGFCKNPDKDYISKQLGMTMDELNLHYETLEKDGKMLRFKDSEHKIFAQNDKDLHALFAKYGQDNVRILENNVKTLFEPCASCKKQFIVRQELYKIEKLSIEATRKNKFEYAKSNIEFLKTLK